MYNHNNTLEIPSSAKPNGAFNQHFLCRVKSVHAEHSIMLVPVGFTKKSSLGSFTKNSLKKKKSSRESFIQLYASFCRVFDSKQTRTFFIHLCVTLHYNLALPGSFFRSLGTFSDFLATFFIRFAVLLALCSVYTEYSTVLYIDCV